MGHLLLSYLYSFAARSEALQGPSGIDELRSHLTEGVDSIEYWRKSIKEIAEDRLVELDKPVGSHTFMATECVLLGWTSSHWALEISLAPEASGGIAVNLTASDLGSTFARVLATGQAPDLEDKTEALRDAPSLESAKRAAVDLIQTRARREIKENLPRAVSLSGHIVTHDGGAWVLSRFSSDGSLSMCEAP